MKKGTRKSPITIRSREEIIRDNEIARKRKIVVEQFYPALIQATDSIDQAKMLINAASQIIMEEVMMTMRERLFGDIYKSLVKKLSPNDERLLEIENLFAPFKNDTLFTAREMIEGMNGAINQMIQDENQKRPLSSYTPDWNKFLNK